MTLNLVLSCSGQKVEELIMRSFSVLLERLLLIFMISMLDYISGQEKEVKLTELSVL